MHEDEGNVMEEKRPHIYIAYAVHLMENMEALQVAMQCSSGKSTWRSSRELGISHHSISKNSPQSTGTVTIQHFCTP
jgi:hypothetical protein